MTAFWSEVRLGLREFFRHDLDSIQDLGWSRYALQTVSANVLAMLPALFLIWTLLTFVWAISPTQAPKWLTVISSLYIPFVFMAGCAMFAERGVLHLAALGREAAKRSAGIPDPLNRKELDALFDVARKGRLPADFRQWDRADKQGYTVAHAAAYSGQLPADFDQWNLAGDDGWTVAHVAAHCGNLPEGFGQWDLADKRGVTVGQVAAAHGHPAHQTGGNAVYTGGAPKGDFP